MPRLAALSALLLVCAPLLHGCTTVPTNSLRDSPATMRSIVGMPAARDERARYRSMFCEALQHSASSPSEPGCDELLWRLPGEMAPAEVTPPPVREGDSPRVLIVGGAFGDCFPPASTPFVDSVAQLRRAGVDIDYVEVSGRSSSELNAATIATRILSMPAADLHPLVLIGYSKGAADILQALAGYAEAAKRVSAVISVAGAVNGSPLATRYAGVYRRLLSHRRLAACPPGDDGVLTSLDVSRRLSWLETHPLPVNIKYYSIATFTTSRRLARALGHTYRLLAKIDARNDGQLLANDELIPGAALLGYANADHWAIAVNMEDEFPFLAHRAAGKHPFPQRVLITSLLRLVQEDLTSSTQPRPAAVP